MAHVEVEFVSKFHSLSGITLKDRYRNFNALLNQTQATLNKTSEKISLSSLIPRTPLEESLKVTALMHFKSSGELLDVLKTENPFLIERVMKQSSWFIKQAFADVTPEDMVTQLFPKMSYNTKQKLLTQLSYHINDQHVAEKYFYCIKEHYGYYLASKLIPSCSGNFIIKCIEQYKTEITPRQLALIIKRHPHLTELILEKLDQQNAKIPTGIKYKTVFKYLSKKDPQLFIKLHRKYSPYLFLGSKETKTFIKSLKSDTLKNNIKLAAVLKTKQIGPSMGENFNDFYLAHFPKRISQLKTDLRYNIDLLNHLTGSEKLKVFGVTFKEVYGNEFWEYSDFIEETLIELMPPDERSLWLESVSRPSHIPEETWISYYKSEKSIPLLKEKILSSSVNLRKKYIVALINTCKINKDESGLLDVLKYINSKHRNEQNSVMLDVLTVLHYDFNENQLSKEHWDEIFQCIQLYMLRNGYCYYNRELLQKYLYYHLSKNLPINNVLEHWAKNYPSEYNICGKNAKFERYCLVQFESLISLGYKADELSKGYARYMYCVRTFNERNPQNAILINPKKEHIEYIKTALSNTYDYDAQGAASLIIMQNCELAIKEGLLELYFDKESYFGYQETVMKWLIKEKPSLLTPPYFNFFLKATSYSNFISRFFGNYCRKYTHLGFPQLICEESHSIINNVESPTNVIKGAIIALSLLSTPQQFIKFAEPYYPVGLTPDIETDQIIYIKQQTIAAHFRNVFPYSEIFQALLKFSKGDYLKFAQKSINVCTNQAPENILYPFFLVLKDSAVSVRKHAIFLSSRILNKSQANAILTAFHKTEKNSSLRKVLFKTVFFAFLKDPSEHLWNSTKQFMGAVEFSDKEAFEILTSCRVIPREYFFKYWEYSWDIVAKCTIKSAVEEAQLRLLNLISPLNITDLPNEFCLTVIKQNLFACDKLTDLQRAFHTFTCRYLIYNADKEQLPTIFTLIKNYKTANCNNIEMIPLMYKLIYNFAKQFCDEIIDKNCLNKSIFEPFLLKWENILQPWEAFDEFVYLQLTSIYLTASRDKLNITEIGKKIAGVCNVLHKENCLLAKSFSNNLSVFLKHFYDLEFIGESDENEVLLIKSIVDNRDNFMCLEIATHLLPCCIPIAPFVKEKYDYIIDVIANEQNHKVKVVFYTYLRNTVTN